MARVYTFHIKEIISPFYIQAPFTVIPDLTTPVLDPQTKKIPPRIPNVCSMYVLSTIYVLSSTQY
jgi:hypothetical protein